MEKKLKIIVFLFLLKKRYILKYDWPISIKTTNFISEKNIFEQLMHVTRAHSWQKGKTQTNKSQIRESWFSYTKDIKEQLLEIII